MKVNNTDTKHQPSFLATRLVGSTMLSATKRGYIISHSDISKSAVESEPPRGVGTMRVRSASTFVCLDFFHGALASAVFYRQGFVDEVARERDCRVDFQRSHAAMIVEARALEACPVSATYTLTRISLASVQSLKKSLSEHEWRFDGCEQEPQVGLKDNTSNASSISLDDRFITPTSAVLTSKYDGKACAGSTGREAYAWQVKINKVNKTSLQQYITQCNTHKNHTTAIFS
jgi:hypothetical protein